MADCKVSLGVGGTPLFIQFAVIGSRFKWRLYRENQQNFGEGKMQLRKKEKVA